MPRQVQFRERRSDSGGAVVDVVRITERVKSCELERLARGRRCPETLVGQGALAAGIVQAALQIAKEHVGSLERIGYLRKRDRRVSDVHQIDVTPSTSGYGSCGSSELA
jgi:hypothetical protein